MPNKTYLNNLRKPTSENPLRILFSACLLGTLCGADGTSYGSYPHIIKLSHLPNVKITSFCPEHFLMGTPREIPDIINGTGADVLNNNAKVISESGKDLTKEMVAGARQMLSIAQENSIELAIMMDVSAACGSQVIYRGHRLSENPMYQIGNGVAAELLKRNGFEIISQRDFKSLDILLSKLDENYMADGGAVDHDETEWYKGYFGQ